MYNITDVMMILRLLMCLLSSQQTAITVSDETDCELCVCVYLDTK